MDQFVFLFSAYAAIFIAIAGYVLFLGRRQAQLKAMLESLERKISDAPNPSSQEP